DRRTETSALRANESGRICPLLGLGAETICLVRLLLGHPAITGLAKPGHGAADHHPQHDREQEIDEEGQLEAKRRISRVERIKREQNRRAVGHGQRDQDDRERHENENEDESVQHEFSAMRCAYFSMFRRSRSSLPVLKNGTHFSSTSTDSPVRGLRPVRAGRFFTEKAPKPRSSTRFPSASAVAISSEMALMIFSTSRRSRCGLRFAMICTSSDLIIFRFRWLIERSSLKLLAA